jgi:hypothetical protein
MVVWYGSMISLADGVVRLASSTWRRDDAVR